MKILVTGANGFIGSNLVSELVKDKKNKVRALVHRNSDNIKDYNIEIIKGDVKDKDTVEEAVKGCKLVYHLAAKVGQWSRRKEEFYETNVLGTRNVLQASLDAKVKRVVQTLSFISTEAAEKKHNPYDMEYQRTKHLADLEADKFLKKELDIVRVYPTVVIGVGCLTDFGKGIILMYNYRPFLIGDGKNHMNVVAVEDVVKGHILAAKKGKCGRRYVLSGVNLTMNEYYKIATEVLHVSEPIHIPKSLALLGAGILELMSGIAEIPPFLTRSTIIDLLEDWHYTPADGIGYKHTTKKQIAEILPKMLKWYQKKRYCRS